MFKIAIVGPESTGKSELSVALAAYFQGDFVPEFAREYVENLDRQYTYDDVCTIARKQIEEQNGYLNRTEDGFVFFDTELIITKVWFEYCYKKVPEFVTQRIAENHFDLYLLCYPDLEWVADPVREHGGDERLFFYEWYKREIEKTGKPFEVIKGIGNIRVENAINVVNTLL